MTGREGHLRCISKRRELIIASPNDIIRKEWDWHHVRIEELMITISAEDFSSHDVLFRILLHHITFSHIESKDYTTGINRAGLALVLRS